MAARSIEARTGQRLGRGARGARVVRPHATKAARPDRVVAGDLLSGPPASGRDRETELGKSSDDCRCGDAEAEAVGAAAGEVQAEDVARHGVDDRRS